MKTIHKLKCLAAAGTFAVLASASPAFAQSSVNQPADTQMRQTERTDGQIIEEPAGADNTSNWSWIGLLGLAGLFGLKRHHEARDETYRPVRS